MKQGFEYSVTAYARVTQRLVSEASLPGLTREEVNVFNPEETQTPPYLYNVYPIASTDAAKIALVKKLLPQFEFDFVHCDHFFEVTSS